jgi:hypothetical protein
MIDWFFVLLNSTLSSALNVTVTVNNELGRMYKRVICACCDILSWHLCGWTEEKLENYWNRWLPGRGVEQCMFLVSASPKQHVTVSYIREGHQDKGLITDTQKLCANEEPGQTESFDMSNTSSGKWNFSGNLNCTVFSIPVFCFQ